MLLIRKANLTDLEILEIDQNHHEADHPYEGELLLPHPTLTFLMFPLRVRKHPLMYPSALA